MHNEVLRADFCIAIVSASREFASRGAVKYVQKSKYYGRNKDCYAQENLFFHVFLARKIKSEKRKEFVFEFVKIT